MLYKQHHPKSRKPRGRCAIAVTELAICLPVLVLIALSTIECCTMLFLQQSLSIASYEGARIAILPDATASVVKRQMRQILSDREVEGAVVTITPASPDRADEGTWLKIEASAAFSTNSMLGGYLFAGRTLTATVEMIKEN